MQDLISKAATLLEALPYIQKFSGETFVVKYGGSFMDSPDVGVRNGVARDIVFLEAVEINPVVVHGGGKAITRAMERQAEGKVDLVIDLIHLRFIDVSGINVLLRAARQARAGGGTLILRSPNRAVRTDPRIRRRYRPMFD